MSLFGLLKRHPGIPSEVIQAACHFYGLSPEHVPAPTIQAEQLTALSDDVWVVTLPMKGSTVVAYNPHEKGQAIAAPWYAD